MLVLSIFQVAVPFAAALWLGVGHAPSQFDLWMRVAAAWLTLFGIGVAGVWLLLPRSTLVVVATAMLTASTVGIVRFRGGRRKDPSMGGWPSRAFALGLATLGSWAAIPAMDGWRTPAKTVNLTFPFARGQFLVANGGGNKRINGHFVTLDPRARRWRGESYAVDLVRVDRVGFRTSARRIFYGPADPAAYLSFGTPVMAPCEGRVEAVENSRPDMPVPTRDRRNLGGNFVLLRCGEHVVFLGHFRRGRVFVNGGANVRAGQPLGEVGNSGNTDEPHLHIHVQTPGTAGEPLSGEPVALTFRGRFPVRNMILRGARADASIY